MVAGLRRLSIGAFGANATAALSQSKGAAGELGALPSCTHALRTGIQTFFARDMHDAGGGDNRSSRGSQMLDRPLSQDPQVQQAAAVAEQQHARRSGSHSSLLSSVNDPEHYGLGSSWAHGPAYWLGSSMSNLEYEMPSSLRNSYRSPLPSQGFSTAKTQRNIQRAVPWGSSLRDPLPLPWQSSMVDPPQQARAQGAAVAGTPAGSSSARSVGQQPKQATAGSAAAQASVPWQSSMADPAHRRVGSVKGGSSGRGPSTSARQDSPHVPFKSSMVDPVA